MLPLFKSYKKLKQSFPTVTIGRFPTPIIPLIHLGEHVKHSKLYLKQDGFSGRLYGGNKIRKLEFLLGDALQNRTDTIFTFGCVGSNHALATAKYAQKLRLNCHLFLLPQPNSRAVQNNLLHLNQTGAILHPYDDFNKLDQKVRYQLHKLKNQHHRIAIIDGGGSSPIGTLGFVNAAFELAEQINAGQMEEPDIIYVPLGTMGTAVGLTLGLRSLGFKTIIQPVRVVPDFIGNVEKAVKLYNATAQLLQQWDSAFPVQPFSYHHLNIIHSFYGKGYAQYTDAGQQAVQLLREKEAIQLEGTYTGKTMAALLQKTQKGLHKNKVVLFWNTYSAVPQTTSNCDYHNLPRVLHTYFESPTQRLDRPLQKNDPHDLDAI